MAYRIVFECRVVSFESTQYNVGLPHSKKVIRKSHESRMLLRFLPSNIGSARYGYGLLDLEVGD